jgi:alcohol dehydrogenase class IV
LGTQALFRNHLIFQIKLDTFMSIDKFSFPTPIHFGVGARKLVGKHLQDLGYKRPLIVTDKAMADLPLMAEFISHASYLCKKSDLARSFARPANLMHVSFCSAVNNSSNIFLLYHLLAAASRAGFATVPSSPRSSRPFRPRSCRPS